MLLAYMFKKHMILPKWTKALSNKLPFHNIFTADSAEVTYGIHYHMQIVDLEARTQFINQLQ